MPNRFSRDFPNISPKEELLFDYCRIGSVEKLRSRLLKGVNMNLRDHSQKTLLHYAAQFGNLKEVSLLLSAGAEVSACDKFGKTPLHLCDNALCAMALLQAGAEVETLDSHGNSPLHEASCGREVAQAELIHCLIQSGGQVNRKNLYQQTPFHHAMVTGNLGSCLELIRYGADNSLINQNGQTPLQCFSGEEGAQEENDSFLQKVERALEQQQLKQAIGLVNPRKKSSKSRVRL